MVNTIKSMAVACVMGVVALGSSSSFAYTITCPDGGATFPLNGCALEGVNSGTFPYFDNVVAVSYKTKNDTAQITAKSYKGSVDNLLVVDTDTSYSIDKEKYSLKASVDSNDVATGALKISGTIDGEKFTVTADLAGPVALSDDGTLVGFDTKNIVCSDVITTLTGGCTTNESIYLNLLEAIGPVSGFDKVSTAGRAITTIPVPAAAWLFGTGLLGLIAMSRRRGDMA